MPPLSPTWWFLPLEKKIIKTFAAKFEKHWNFLYVCHLSTETVLKICTFVSKKKINGRGGCVCVCVYIYPKCMDFTFFNLLWNYLHQTRQRKQQLIIGDRYFFTCILIGCHWLTTAFYCNYRVLPDVLRDLTCASFTQCPLRWSALFMFFEILTKYMT